MFTVTYNLLYLRDTSFNYNATSHMNVEFDALSRDVLGFFVQCSHCAEETLVQFLLKHLRIFVKAEPHICKFSENSRERWARE